MLYPLQYTVRFRYPGEYPCLPKRKDFVIVSMPVLEEKLRDKHLLFIEFFCRTVC